MTLVVTDEKGGFQNVSENMCNKAKSDGNNSRFKQKF